MVVVVVVQTFDFDPGDWIAERATGWMDGRVSTSSRPPTKLFPHYFLECLRSASTRCMRSCYNLATGMTNKAAVGVTLLVSVHLRPKLSVEQELAWGPGPSYQINHEIQYQTTVALIKTSPRQRHLQNAYL